MVTSPGVVNLTWENIRLDGRGYREPYCTKEHPLTRMNSLPVNTFLSFSHFSCRVCKRTISIEDICTQFQIVESRLEEEIPDIAIIFSYWRLWINSTIWEGESRREAKIKDLSIDAINDIELSFKEDLEKSLNISLIHLEDIFVVWHTTKTKTSIWGNSTFTMDGIWMKMLPTQR